MIAYSGEITIRRPVGDVFDFVALHCYDNHPHWEPEVLEIRRLTDGPVRVGSRAVMVRRDFGKVTQTEYEVTELEANRRIAFRHDNPQMDFTLTFDFRPDPAGTRFAVDVVAQPHGWLRVMTPPMRRTMSRTGRRILGNIQRLVEDTVGVQAALGRAGNVETLARR